jgi:MFS family permease
MERSPTYVGVLASGALCYTALGSVLPILPPLVSGPLRGGSVQVGLAVGAPALAAVLTRPAGGRLADRLGPRRLVLAGAALMAVATAPLVVGPARLGLDALVAGRVATGAGEGAMMAAAVLWMLRLAGPARRGRALGHIGLANYLGLAMGPLLAAPVGGADHPGRVFALATALPCAGMVLAALLPDQSEKPPLRTGAEDRPQLRGVVSAVLLPGCGLALVNVGYVSLLSFGAAASGAHGIGGGGLVVPTFASLVILTRTVGGSLPDRLGAVPTLVVAALLEAGSLAVVAAAASLPVLLAGTAGLAVGQALAVPALGLLALQRVPASRHGAASGVFFAFFDLGVGLGGPATGAAAHLAAAPAGALLAAAGAVALVPLIPFVQRVRETSPQRGVPAWGSGPLPGITPDGRSPPACGWRSRRRCWPRARRRRPRSAAAPLSARPG